MVQQGESMYELLKKIFPYCRSITGEGVRQTLADIQEYVGGVISNKEIASGTQVYDWTVPKEWNIEDAYIENENGERIIDFRDNNLHVMGYSYPIDKWVSRDELMDYVYVQEDQPDVIPYVTSYYKERSGFCMTKNQRDSLPEGRYHMVIDSRLFDGVLNYGEVILPGESSQEILITSYTCHPSMGNNECSGPVVWAELLKYTLNIPRRRYTYRFVLHPETIGSIAYISRNIDTLKSRVQAGFVLSCVGDDRAYSIVHSRYGSTLADKVLDNLISKKDTYCSYSYLQRGSDERQYNAPGVDLPVVAFCRSKYGEYPEYHTSKDDLTLVSAEGLYGAYSVMKNVINVLENNRKYRVKVLCEPQLGKRNLYPTISKKGSYADIRTLTNFIAYADGTCDMLSIADRIGVSADKLIPIADKLLKEELIEIVD